MSRSSTEINARACVKTIDELPEGIDLAVLAIPEAGVLDAVRQLAAARCHARGPVRCPATPRRATKDRRASRHSREVAEQAGMLLVGPNCMGFTNLAAGVPRDLRAALALRLRETRIGVGMVAQSGVHGGQPARRVPRPRTAGDQRLVDRQRSLGLCRGRARVLHRRPADPRDRGVCRAGSPTANCSCALAAQARAAGKPIMLLMPGKSARAREAAQSHTGALAGDHATATAVLRREAVVVVDSLDELLDTDRHPARYPVPPAGGTAFMTGSGAMKNIALDFADDLGLSLPALTA